MFQVFRNAWRVQDLRKKIIFTLFMLLIFRLGSAIPVPFINRDILSQLFDGQFSDTIFGMVNMMSGGAFASATIFALSIQPYINASIIMNLLTVGIPALERMVKEGGEEGRKKIASITRIVTVGLGILQGWGYYTVIRGHGILQDESLMAAIVIILSFTAGTAFIMWLGEQITEFGIGNGISIILFTGIVSRLPAVIPTGISMAQAGQVHFVILALVIAVALVGFIVFITQAERRIPVQYAKRMVGRKMYGGQSSHLPLKVNMSGVMPIIFAQSIASFPATIMAFVNPNPAEGTFWFGFSRAFNHTSLLYAGIYFLLIIGFGYFYTAIQFNPVEIANNLKGNGGFIPGFRPGRPTSDFIRKVLGKITLFGSLFLGVIATLPILIGVVVPGVANTGLALGGTSILIVVGVALETMKQMEAQMMMRHYKGFLE
jgi:preprotein translocase subunit SecY